MYHFGNLIQWYNAFLAFQIWLICWFLVTSFSKKLDYLFPHQINHPVNKAILFLNVQCHFPVGDECFTFLIFLCGIVSRVIGHGLHTNSGAGSSCSGCFFRINIQPVHLKCSFAFGLDSIWMKTCPMPLASFNQEFLCFLGDLNLLFNTSTVNFKNPQDILSAQQG